MDMKKENSESKVNQYEKKYSNQSRHTLTHEDGFESGATTKGGRDYMKVVPNLRESSWKLTLIKRVKCLKRKKTQPKRKEP